MSDWLREVESAGYSIQYTGPESERIPLLNAENHRTESKCVRIFWIVFLTILFGMGLGIGCYLIIQEDNDYTPTGPFVLITRDGWLSPTSPSKILPYAQDVGGLTHVVITQTSTANCDTMNQCIKIIRDIQHDHVSNRNLTDIAYNFLVSGDGTTYEARGWYHQPELKNIVANRTLLIAFLGNFELEQPTSVQVEQFKVLLNHALYKKILNPCYTLILYKENPQNGGGQLVHVVSRLNMENNKRKLNINCS